MDELALHPTVKPVAMIADAIKDVSRRGGIVLDLFGGSGSTLIAAHKTGRRARLCELDPVYCDRILSRWETFAKDDAELIACALSQDTSDAETIHRESDANRKPSQAAGDETGLSPRLEAARSHDPFPPSGPPARLEGRRANGAHQPVGGAEA